MSDTVRKVSFGDIPGARVLASGLTFLESPRYCNGEIYFSDEATVCACDLQGHTRTVSEVPARMCLGIHVDEHAVYASAPYERTI